MLRERVKQLDEQASHLRVQLRDANKERQRAELQLGNMRAELAATRLSAANSAAATSGSLRDDAEANGDGSGGGATAALQAMQEKLTEVTATLAERTSECEALRLQRDGGGLVQTLQAKLGAAEQDLSRLVAEREKLMEISNMLRADLNRVLSESFVQPSATAAVERAEREVASRYETKLTEIEAAMRELIGQNKSLKEELRRWTSEGTELANTAAEMRTSRSTTRREAREFLSRATPATAGGGVFSGGISGIRGLGMMEHGLIHSGLPAASSETPPRPMFAWGEGGGEDGGDDDDLDDDDGEDVAEAPTGGPGESSSLARPSAERALKRASERRSDGSGAGSRPATADAAMEGGGGSRARARAKLDEAKSSLVVSGSGAPMSAARTGMPAATQSDRATASQPMIRWRGSERSSPWLPSTAARPRPYTPVVGTMRETFAPCDSAQVQSAVSVGVRAAARASAAAVRAAHRAIIVSPWRLPSTLDLDLFGRIRAQGSGFRLKASRCAQRASGL